MRGVSLEEIAAATRISTRFLEALEKEQWGELPGGVFNRGFIRSVSKYLGLDEDDMVAEYALETQQGVEPLSQGNGRHNGHAVSHTRFRGAMQPRATTDWPRRPWVPAAVVLTSALTLLVGGGWLIGGKYGPAIVHRLNRHPVAAASEPRMDRAPSAAAAQPSATGSIGDSGTVPATRTADTARIAQPEPPDSPSNAADPLELKIEAGKPAHVQVFADGKSVFDGRMEVGNTHTFQARENFQVTSSEGRALLLALNSQQLAPLGSPGRPATVTLTRKDLPSAGGAH